MHKLYGALFIDSSNCFSMILLLRILYFQAAMGISEDLIKFEPLSDDFDQNNEPLENGFGKKIVSFCNYRMKIQNIFVCLYKLMV